MRFLQAIFRFSPPYPHQNTFYAPLIGRSTLKVHRFSLMPTPTVFQQEVFDCTALDVLVRCGFRALNNDDVETDYCGLRGVYFGDEQAWDEDGEGRWKSAPAPRSIPTNLNITGATALPRTVATERDTVWRVASGMPVTVTWELLYDSLVRHLISSYRVRAWDCSDGSEVFNQAVTGFSANLGMLPDGSYTIAVAIESAPQQHMSAAKYLELVGELPSEEYLYTQDDIEFFYDPERNLGVRPADALHSLNVAREEIVAAGEQQDKPQWIGYATSHESWSSQWAMTPIVVGDGGWEVGDGALPAPDVALIAAPTGDETHVVTQETLGDFAVAFDPFARSVACFYQATNGIRYIGGERSCDDGTETALWQWHGDGTATLLATSKNYTTGLCECAGLQSAHEARRMVELPDGTLIVQTLCSLFRYDPHGHRIEEKLVPWPRATDGHPGGRSLLINGKDVAFTTEYFGLQSEGEPAAQFYNTYVSRSIDVPQGIGIGTLAHLDGTLALWKGRVYGTVQNKYAVEEAVQGVAMMSPDGWQRTAMHAYRAATHQLQRTARIGWHLVATGKAPSSELPLFLSNDGTLIEWGNSDYRLRHIDSVSNTTGYETGLAPGFLPTDEYDAPRRLIEIGDRATGRILDSEPETEIDCTDAACQLEDFGPGAVWFGEPLTVWGDNLISGVAVVNAERWLSPSTPKPFTEYFSEMLAAKDALIWARFDSSAPVEALETYTYPLPVLGDLWMLPFPVKEKVEFVVVLPEDAGKIPPVRLMVVC